MVGYYGGKTVRFVVGFAPGGGFDTYARAIARHMGKHITSGLFALGCGAVFYAMFGQLVRIPFESGFLVGMLEG